MKTVKSIDNQNKYTNSELLQLFLQNPCGLGVPQLVGRKKYERIIFPDTIAGTYVVSVKCSKKINVYLGEYVPASPKKVIFDGYYSDITYFADCKKRKSLYDKITEAAKYVKSLLG